MANNRIDSAIDDMFKLLDLVGGPSVTPVDVILEEQRKAHKERKEREQLENMRLAELERRSGCNDQ
jgi:hypothetical protein